MIAHVDSSVLLRVVLRQRDALREWMQVEGGVASALVEVDCLRTLDRIRATGEADIDELAPRGEAVRSLLDRMDVVERTTPVLRRAAEPMPTALGTLGALHLATALLWRERTGVDRVMATHDHALAVAARGFGLAVVGEPARRRR